MNLQEDNYFIKNGYAENVPKLSYEDTINDSAHYQRDVYELARKLILEQHLRSVLDVSCGSGVKLYSIIEPVCAKITGIDSAEIINFCRSNYDFGEWLVVDLDNPSGYKIGSFDLIICADVIEHLAYPDKLLYYIKRNAHDESIIVMSTPERDIVRGRRSFGPSPNPMHVREWNTQEFHDYLHADSQ